MDPIPLPPPIGGMNEKVPKVILEEPYCELAYNWDLRPDYAAIRKGDNALSISGVPYTATMKIIGVRSLNNTQHVEAFRDTATNQILVGASTFAGPAVDVYFSTSYFNGYAYFFWADGATEIAIKSQGGVLTSLAGYTYGGSNIQVRGGCCVYKNRHYMPKYGSSGYYYSGVDLITGACDFVDLSGILTRSANLVNIASFTLSDSLSSEALIAFIFASGEVVFYRGAYPGAADWTLVGRGDVGIPYALGSGTNYQGDYIQATRQGAISLKDLFLKGSRDAASLTTNSNISKTWESLSDYYGVVDVIFDDIKNRLLFHFAYAEGEDQSLSPESVNSTWCVLQTDSLSWAVHQRTGLLQPARCSRTIKSNAIGISFNGDIEILFFSARQNSAGVRQAGYVIMSKEGSTRYTDETSGIDGGLHGISFDITSAPVKNGRAYVQLCTGLDVLMESDLNAYVNYSLIGDLGVTVTEDQKIPATGTGFAKPFVNIGIAASYIQYRIHGETPDSFIAETVGYNLYGLNFWQEIGGSPR